nr:TPA_asm: M99 iORF [Murid betaherpesvirus 1]DBA07866.1 TPA_asm: M99 iORF [Murid betaherpesvirus 1]
MSQPASLRRGLPEGFLGATRGPRDRILCADGYV